MYRACLTFICGCIMIFALTINSFAASPQKEFRVGFVYISPAADAGWSFGHNEGRKAVEALPGVTTSFVESVPEGADSERVILNMARKNFNIIFTTSYGYMDSTVKVSKKFPETSFFHCAGYKKGPNMTAYFGRMYQARFLTGMVAGAMSKSKKLGYVAAFPIPEVIRGINAFTEGARLMKPDIETTVVWTRTWYDPAKEKEAAKSLLDVGCDVIAQHQDSPGPQEAAQERGAYSVGYHTDMSKFAPKAHLTAAVWNWKPFYVDAVKKVMDGTWEHNKFYWPGLAEGTVNIAAYGAMVPQNVREKVEARKQEIVKGTYKVFTGPIMDQQGKEMLAAGKTFSDEDLLRMDWFVKGVVGSTK